MSSRKYCIFLLLIAVVGIGARAFHTPLTYGSDDTPYRICYEVHDIDREIRAFQADRYVIAEALRPASAFDGRRIVFSFTRPVLACSSLSSPRCVHENC